MTRADANLSKSWSTAKSEIGRSWPVGCRWAMPVTASWSCAPAVCGWRHGSLV